MIPFVKMNGAGNDFVIFDARRKPISLTPAQIRKIADRGNAITKGCDQVIVMEPSQKTDVFMRIYNADGSEVGSCGNATRCVAWLVMEENKADGAAVETGTGFLECERIGMEQIRVNMGKPVHWQPLKDVPEEEINRQLAFAGLGQPSFVNMGNPHVVFFVERIQETELKRLGPIIEKHPLFPDHVNVDVAKVDAENQITLRVWERGAGLTRACGTGACATLVAANRRGLAGRAAAVRLPGGVLTVEWRKNDDVLMSGPIEKEFEETLAL